MNGIDKAGNEADGRWEAAELAAQIKASPVCGRLLDVVRRADFADAAELAFMCGFFSYLERLIATSNLDPMADVAALNRQYAAVLAARAEEAS